MTITPLSSVPLDSGVNTVNPATSLGKTLGTQRLRLTTLNANGIRAAARKGLAQWLQVQQPDIVCVQELKAQMADIQGSLDTFAMGATASGNRLQGYFQCAEKKGYSGVGLYTRFAPSEVRYGFDGGAFDSEGRYVEARFDTPTQRFSIVSAYFPSGTSGTERQDAKYRFLDLMYTHLQALCAERDFIVCADVNIAHRTLDLKNWKNNQKNSGFLPEERAWMDKLLQNGLVDVYRHLEPDAADACYTWWSNRGAAYEKNVGWRLDYHLSTPALAAVAGAVSIYKGERFSDHAPVTIDYVLV